MNRRIKNISFKDFEFLVFTKTLIYRKEPFKLIIHEIQRVVEGFSKMSQELNKTGAGSRKEQKSVTYLNEPNNANAVPAT